MEPEDLDERVEWEARRVAAAFGVEGWGLVATKYGGAKAAFSGRTPSGIAVEYELRREGTIESVSMDGCQYLFRCIDEERGWVLRYDEDRPHPELMARGLYRVGCEERGVWFYLNELLSAHEKLELRLSMPREFWPQKWLDEEKAGADL